MDKANNTLKILLIEDDIDDYILIKETLASISYKVELEWCHSSKSALLLIESKPFDIFLVDFFLDEKTGLQLIAEALSTGDKPPFILLTGVENKNIDRDALLVGATDYLDKREITSDKLERVIRYSIEKNKALLKIKFNEQKYRTIFEHSKDIIFLMDQQGSIIEFNEAGKKAFAVRPVSPSVNILDIVECSVAEKQNIQSTLSTSDSLMEMEVHIPVRNGEVMTCLLSFIPVSEAGVHFHGILQDITDRKKSEKNFLQIEKMNAAQRFIRTLAHEVRNPLTNINLAITEMQEQGLDTDLKYFLEIVVRNSGRINSLITELLYSMRSSEFIKEQCSLQTILDAALVSTKDQIQMKNIKVELQTPAEPILVNGDSGRLISAFLNLIQNAIEAVDNNKGSIQISCEKNNKLVRVMIKDNGCGISEENLNRLFEPYFTTKQNGMGLGMATTLNIFQAHQASIEVNSQLGNGTVFIVRFMELE